jgi:hypothetical protein
MDRRSRSPPWLDVVNGRLSHAVEHEDERDGEDRIPQSPKREAPWLLFLGVEASCNEGIRGWEGRFEEAEEKTEGGELGEVLHTLCRLRGIHRPRLGLRLRAHHSPEHDSSPECTGHSRHSPGMIPLEEEIGGI